MNSSFNGKCPKCGKDAFLLLMKCECISHNCSNFNLSLYNEVYDDQNTVSPTVSDKYDFMSHYDFQKKMISSFMGESLEAHQINDNPVFDKEKLEEAIAKANVDVEKHRRYIYSGVNPCVTLTNEDKAGKFSFLGIDPMYLKDLNNE